MCCTRIFHLLEDKASPFGADRSYRNQVIEKKTSSFGISRFGVISLGRMITCISIQEIMERLGAFVELADEKISGGAVSDLIILFKVHSLLTGFKDVKALCDLVMVELHEINRIEIGPRIRKQVKLDDLIIRMKVEIKLAKEDAHFAYENILEVSNEKFLSNLYSLQRSKDDLKASVEFMLAKLREFKCKA
ncbi:hypothetical protein TorRG33x02_098600 [Trema orientale]|uniref:Uncharacterized protein n=1 Tax=Trema orientale TaxID=63057 RepID=A0A2P5F9E3_TREOI|nr:hypothetical protein TorRG33x02_098600 [Trema orientale]